MARRGNGEGSISKRPTGTWQGQISLGRDPVSGKVKRPTFYGRTRKEVAEKIKAALAEHQKGEYIEKNIVTVAQYAKDWLAGKQVSKSENTYAKYESLVRIHITPGLGDIPLQQLTRSTIQDFITEKAKQRAPKTIAELHMIISNIVEMAVEDRVIPRNVCKKIELPTIIEQPIKILTEEEVTIILTAVFGSLIYDAVFLEYSTGMRRGEVLGLAYDDLDFDNNMIDINKTWVMVKGKAQWSDTATGTKSSAGKRKIPCPAEAMELLKKRSEDNPSHKYVFQAATGLPLRPDTYYHMFKDLIKKELKRRHTEALKEDPDAELETINISPHDLRHNFATKLVTLNIHDRLIQAQLGHIDMRATRRYTHAVTEAQQAAVNKMSAHLNAVIPQLKTALQ